MMSSPKAGSGAPVPPRRGTPVLTTPLPRVASPIARAGKNYSNLGASFPKCGPGGTRKKKTDEARENGVAHFQLFLDKKHFGKLDDLEMSDLTNKELWSEFAGYLATSGHHLNNSEILLSQQSAESIYSGVKNAMAQRFPGEELFKANPNGDVAAFHMSVKADMKKKISDRNTELQKRNVEKSPKIGPILHIEVGKAKLA